MGMGPSLTREAWASYADTHIRNTTHVNQIYQSRDIDPALNPHGIGVRESCDSAEHPLSTPIAIFLDVTGSMDAVLDSVARTGLVSFAGSMYDRKPVTDPHILFGGIGDVHAGDKAPLQVTQFESDIRVAEQLSKLWLERCGGGNNYESYMLAWYFAATHTKIDSFDKRNKKGYLFTIGDECPTPYLTAQHIQTVFGYRPEFERKTAEELLAMVSERYEVYHLMVAQGNYMQIPARREKAISEWRALLGQRAVLLTDHTKIGEVMTSLIQFNEGIEPETIVSSWEGATSTVVRTALDSFFDSVLTPEA